MARWPPVVLCQVLRDETASWAPRPLGLGDPTETASPGAARCEPTFQFGLAAEGGGIQADPRVPGLLRDVHCGGGRGDGSIKPNLPGLAMWRSGGDKGTAVLQPSAKNPALPGPGLRMSLFLPGGERARNGLPHRRQAELQPPAGGEPCDAIRCTHLPALDRYGLAVSSQSPSLLQRGCAPASRRSSRGSGFRRKTRLARLCQVRLSHAPSHVLAIRSYRPQGYEVVQISRYSARPPYLVHPPPGAYLSRLRTEDPGDSSIRRRPGINFAPFDAATTLGRSQRNRVAFAPRDASRAQTPAVASTANLSRPDYKSPARRAARPFGSTVL